MSLFKVSIFKAKRKNLYRVLILFVLVFNLFAVEEQSVSALTKQKIELKELKKELNDFYNKKEEEYKNRKKELETIQSKIQKERQDIEKLKEEHIVLLGDLKKAVDDKTTKIYNRMKPKIAASIFDAMISEGKIDDVFDIILKLKEKNVTSIMRYMNLQSSMIITEKLEQFKRNLKE